MQPPPRTVVPRPASCSSKDYDERGFIFYTNYEGRKAKELEANPNCTLAFYWGELERQVRIEGHVARAIGRRIRRLLRQPPPRQPDSGPGPRSRAILQIESRERLEERLQKLEAEYEGREIPRPPFWGGYRVEPESMEFWQGRENRLHDRLLYTRRGGEWEIQRLAAVKRERVYDPFAAKIGLFCGKLWW